MSSFAIASIVLACVFSAAILGLVLRRAMPVHHLTGDTKDSVKSSMGLVATMTALVLGLLVASAKSSYDTQRGEVIQMSGKIAFLERVLNKYGPDAKDARTVLQDSLKRLITQMWPDAKPNGIQSPPSTSGGEALYDAIGALVPQTDAEKTLKSQALASATEIGQMRWLLFEQSGSSISTPLLVIMVMWLASLFFSFGLFAPPNATSVSALLVAALSVSIATFLILELDTPFDGLLQIPSEPMRNLLASVGR